MKYVAAILLAVGLFAGSAPQAVAQYTHDCARIAVQRGQALPLSVILGRVRSRVGGRLAGVRLLGCPYGPYRYVLRMLKYDGRVSVVIADARTGRIIRVSGQGPVYNRGGNRFQRRNNRRWWRRRQ